MRPVTPGVVSKGAARWAFSAQTAKVGMWGGVPPMMSHPLEPTTVKVAGTVEVRSFPGVAVAPGLALAHDAGAGVWLLIHTRSGTALGKVCDAEAAGAWAFEVAAMADWTGPGDDYRDDAGLCRRVFERRRAYGGRRAGTTCPPVLPDLSPAEGAS